jgi:hypothetical protein
MRSPSIRRRRPAAGVLLFLAVLLQGCTGEPMESASAFGGSDAPATAAPPWRTAPAEGVEVTGAEPMIVETAPHAVIWTEEIPPMTPPYRVDVAVEKLSGRLHEGYGIVFGGDPLDAPESEQRYAYFLVRGDGAFLVKLRERSETPVVQDWTAHPAVRRDGESGAANRLAVEVRHDSVTFLVNDVRVAGLPSESLRTEGRAGLRVAHHVRLSVRGYRVTPLSPDGP